MLSLEFFIDIILQALGSIQSFKRNEYLEYLLGGGGGSGQCVGLTNLPISCAPSVLKSGSLNLLDPSGPIQASTATALPFYCIGLKII